MSLVHTFLAPTLQQRKHTRHMLQPLLSCHPHSCALYALQYMLMHAVEDGLHIAQVSLESGNACTCQAGCERMTRRIIENCSVPGSRANLSITSHL